MRAHKHSHFLFPRLPARLSVSVSDLSTAAAAAAEVEADGADQLIQILLIIHSSTCLRPLSRGDQAPRDQDGVTFMGPK